MKKLYLMMGVPGSGKSTFLKENIENVNNTKIVSRDIIRFNLVKENEPYFSKEKQVFQEFIDEIIQGLKEDKDVFADATHITTKSRRKLLNRIPAHLYQEVNIIWVYNKSFEKILAQNELRKDTRSYVPQDVILDMFHNLEAPKMDEGFDHIYIV